MIPRQPLVLEEAISALRSGDFAGLESASRQCVPSPLNGALGEYKRYLEAVGIDTIAQPKIEIIVEDLKELDAEGFENQTHRKKYIGLVRDASKSAAHAFVDGTKTDGQTSELLRKLGSASPIDFYDFASVVFYRRVARFLKEEPKLLDTVAKLPEVMGRMHYAFEAALQRQPEEKYNALFNPFMDPEYGEFVPLADMGRVSMAYHARTYSVPAREFLGKRIDVNLSSRNSSIYTTNKSVYSLAHLLMLFSNALEHEKFMSIPWKVYDPPIVFLSHIHQNLDAAVADFHARDDLEAMAAYASVNAVSGKDDSRVFLDSLALLLCSMMPGQHASISHPNLRKLRTLLEIGGEALQRHPRVISAPERYPDFFNTILPERSEKGNNSARYILERIGPGSYF